jgi:hypothetical protein
MIANNHVQAQPCPTDETPDSPAATPGETWAAKSYEEIAGWRADGTVDAYNASALTAVADFAKKHDCVPVADTTADWFGFGSLKVLFDSTDGGSWYSLVDLLEVTGLDWPALKDLFDEDSGDDEDSYGDADTMVWVNPNDGEAHTLQLVRHSFAMRAMLAGPWSKEFMDNTMGLFRNAMVKSGLADKMGPVVVIEDGVARETNMSFGEFMAAGDMLPSEEDAIAQAMRGPAVNL